MNPGLAMFKKRQHLQEGIDQVPNPEGYERDELFFRPGHTPSSKEASRLYDPGPMSEEAQQQARTAFNEQNMSELEKARESTFSTIGMKIGDEEWEVPTTWDEMPEGVQYWVHNRPQNEWPAWVMDAIEGNARDLLEQGIHPLTGFKVDDPRNTPPSNYARGTSNVQHLYAGVNDLNYDPSYPGPTNPKGSGSGVPTQKFFGGLFNVLGNLGFPGLGALTGPAASRITAMIQNALAQGNVQRANQLYQQYQQNQGGGGGGTGGAGDTSGGGGTSDTGGDATTTAPRTSSAGVGIDPMGNPADPGEWWSPDFGRWTGEDRFGTTPGNYNLQGPGGWAIGARGTGFGEHVLGNPGGAIGWETLGAPGGQANLSSGWGGVAGQQLRHIAKGIFSNDPNPEGIGALYEMTGTKSPSAGQFQQSQQQLQDILQANPSLMSGPTGGGVRRGGSRIPLETVQHGTSNVGLNLFRKKQMLRKPKKNQTI